MNNYDVAGILHSYAEKAAKAQNTIQLRRIIRELKEELDLRKVRSNNDDRQRKDSGIAG